MAAPAPPSPRTREEIRLQAEAVDKLREELQAGRLAICVGSGVTLSACTTQRYRLAWGGMMANGLDYFENQAQALGNLDEHRHEIDRARALLNDPNSSMQDTMDAATRVQNLLKVRQDLFAGWLKHCFKSLYTYVDNPAILDSLKLLHQHGASLLTTNYDDLIEKHLKLQAFDRSSADALVSYKRGALRDTVFHPHGCWSNAENVVLSAEDYYGVRGDQETQDLLKHILSTKTVLFVGCGGGLADPNFGRLMQWIGEKYKRRGATHYILLTRNSVNPVTKLSLNHVRCENFDDIARWLSSLLPQSAQRESTLAELPSNSPRRLLQDWLEPMFQTEYLVDQQALQTGPVDIVDNLAKDGVWAKAPAQTSLVRLIGPPGTGKTAFCTSLINRTLAACRPATYQRARDSVAYFFCTSYDDEDDKGDPILVTYKYLDFLRTILSQLCPPGRVFPALQALYDQCTRHAPGRPATQRELQDVLLQVLQELSQATVPTNGDTIEPGETYLIVDGLDGVPMKHRDAWLVFLRTVTQRQFPHVHLLVSYREGARIRTLLAKSGVIWDAVTCDAKTTKNTMAEYITQRLTDDPQLEDLPAAVRRSVQKRLIDSGKSFRWVIARFRELQLLKVPAAQADVDAILPDPAAPAGGAGGRKRRRP